MKNPLEFSLPHQTLSITVSVTSLPPFLHSSEDVDEIGYLAFIKAQ